MKKSDLAKLIENLNDEDSVLDVLKGIEGLSSQFDATKLTVDDYKSILEKNEGIKGYYTSSFDTAVSHAVENHDKKFNEEKLPKIIEDAIKAKSLEGLTPDQKEIAELKAWKEQAEKEKADMIIFQENTAKLKGVGLDLDLAKYVKTDEDIDFFKNFITNSVNNGVKERLGNKDETPPKDEGLNEEELLNKQIDQAMGIR